MALLNPPYSPAGFGDNPFNQSLNTGDSVAFHALTVNGIPIISNSGALVLKGNIDASGNPNYPAGAVGDAYYITVAGKIGGASGAVVGVGDLVVCKTVNAGGTQAAVGASWFIISNSSDGVLLSANNLSDVANKQTSLTNLTTGATQINHAGLSQALSTGGFLWDKNNNEFSDGLRIGDIINGSWFDFSDGTLWVKSTKVVDASGNGIFTSLKIGSNDAITNTDIYYPGTSTELADNSGYIYFGNGQRLSTNAGGIYYFNGTQLLSSESGELLFFATNTHFVDASGNIYFSNNTLLGDTSGNLFANGTIVVDSSQRWVGSVIDKTLGGTWAIGGAGIVKTDGSGTQSLALDGTDFLAPNGNGSALTGITVSQVSGAALLPIVTNSSPTTGQTVSAGAAKLDETLYITPAGTLLALTISLPTSANSRVGQIVRGFISQIITGLTVNESGSGTVVGSTPITSSVNSYFAYQCFSVAGNGLWGRIN